jgi:hypothetical protein
MALLSFYYVYVDFLAGRAAAVVSAFAITSPSDAV